MTALQKPVHSQKSQARLQWERERIEESRAEIRNGAFMDEEEVEAWLDGLDGDKELPLPEVRYPTPKPPL